MSKMISKYDSRENEYGPPEYIWGFPYMEVPPNGWFIVEHPTKNGWCGGTPISEKKHMAMYLIGICLGCDWDLWTIWYINYINTCFPDFSRRILVAPGPFDKFTCIIGPNGSGKSNIMEPWTDSREVRWMMWKTACHIGVCPKLWYSRYTRYPPKHVFFMTITKYLGYPLSVRCHGVSAWNSPLTTWRVVGWESCWHFEVVSKLQMHDLLFKTASMYIAIYCLLLHCRYYSTERIVWIAISNILHVSCVAYIDQEKTHVVQTGQAILQWKISPSAGLCQAASCRMPCWNTREYAMSLLSWFHICIPNYSSCFCWKSYAQMTCLFPLESEKFAASIALFYVGEPMVCLADQIPYVRSFSPFLLATS